MPRKSKQEPQLMNYLDDLVEKLRGQISEAIGQHDSTAIHQSRVATRRLSAALNVLQPILSKPRRHEFNAMLRKLRRQLGPMRDLDVMIDLVGAASSRAGKIGRKDPALKWVSHHLNQQREKHQAKAKKKVDAEKVKTKLDVWLPVRAEMLTANRAIDSLLAESLHLQLDAFIDHADGISGRRAVQSTKEMRDPHELRIAGKSLRYSLEMAIANGHRLPADVTRSFKKMQDALGQWHDLIVLAERLLSLSVEQLLAHHDAAVQSEVLNLARQYLARATRSLARFSKLWKEGGDEITTIIRRSFPVTRPVNPATFTQSKTDPDLFDLPKTPAELVLPPAPPGEPSTA
jgi:CHAD domain-containing protein